MGVKHYLLHSLDYNSDVPSCYTVRYGKAKEGRWTRRTGERELIQPRGFKPEEPGAWDHLYKGIGRIRTVVLSLCCYEVLLHP